MKLKHLIFLGFAIVGVLFVGHLVMQHGGIKGGLGIGGMNAGAGLRRAG